MRFPVVLCLSAIGACAPAPPEPARGVRHLELALFGGGDPAEVLHGVRDVVLEAVPDFEGSPWRSDPAMPSRLAHAGELDAAALNGLKVGVRGGARCSLRAQWRFGDEGGHQRAEARIPSGRDAVAIDLVHHPGWAGRIRELALEVVPPSGGELPPDLEVLSVRHLRSGFSFGLEREPGNGGLVPVGREAMRAWPSDFGVPLVAKVAIPRGGRLRLHAAPGWVGADPESLHVALWSRADGGAFAFEGVREVPALPNAQRAWTRVAFALGKHAGKTLELALVAGPDRESLRTTAPDPATPREPRRAAVLFGAPIVVGELAGDLRPDAVLITIDTTRADHLLDPQIAPATARFAESAVVFEEAWSVTNSTQPSHASMLTGRYLAEHGATSNEAYLASENETLAEVFRAAGYRTGAAVSTDHIEAGTGLGQGFDRFRLAERADGRDGDAVVQHALRRVEEWSGGRERPFFLWVHLFDPHAPYRPPPGFLEAFEGERPRPPRNVDEPTIPPGVARTSSGKWLGGTNNAAYVDHFYDAGVSYGDALLGRLLDALDLERTAVVVVADHGELLGEHDEHYHHRSLFPEVLRVPLVVHVPGGPKGVVDRQRASGIDVARTLLGACGVEAPAGMRGTDLLRGERAGEVWFEYTRLERAGSFDGRHLLMLELGGADDGARESLYDLVEDPECRTNLAGTRPELLADRVRRFAAWRSSLERGQARERELTTEERETLEDLGYAGEE